MVKIEFDKDQLQYGKYLLKEDIKILKDKVERREKLLSDILFVEESDGF